MAGAGALTIDGTEISTVRRVPLAELAKRTDWFELANPVGWNGGAIDIADGRLWGYTADLVRTVVLGMR